MDLKTEQWIDLYSLCLEKMAQVMSDPQAMMQRMGIDTSDPNVVAPTVGSLNMEAYHDLQESWGRVKVSMRLFGLVVGEDLMLAPLPDVMKSKTWQARPWLEVSHEDDGLVKPLRFEGRDAITAFNFINFFIQHCQAMDPAKHVRDVLEQQGITAENFHEHADRLLIRNPFEENKA